MRSSNTFGVFIGIDTYPDLGGAAALRGARNDARAWLRYARNDLHLAPERCRLLTGPALPADEVGLAPDHVSGASLAEAAEAIHQMVRHLEAEEGATGLLVFCGHGAALGTAVTVAQGDQLGLCMEDASRAGGGLSGVLPFQALDALFQHAHIAERITVVVDACYSELQVERFSSVAAAIGRELTEGSLAPRSRLLLGAALWGTAFEARIDQTWRGAFSFSLLTALSQWRTGRERGVTYARGSYAEVLFRARSVLQALGYDTQQPQLSGTPIAPGMPFNHPGLHGHERDVSVTPDGSRQHREISTGEDIAGVWNGEFQIGGNSLRLFGWAAAGPTNGADIHINNNPAGILDPGHNRFYESDQFDGQIASSTALTLDLQDAVETGGVFVLDLVNYTGSIQPVFEQQQADVPWDPGAAPQWTNPVFGPYTMQVNSSAPGQPDQVPVYIEFHMEAGSLTALRFWTDQPLQGTVALTGSATAQRLTSDPGGIQWHMAPEDPVS